MRIALGVDSLSYHCRIVEREISVEEVFADIGSLGASYVQLDLHHVRERKTSELRQLRSVAEDLGLEILVSGDFIGTPRSGDTPAVGVERIEAWMAKAEAVGSPIVRLASGFYRAELAGQPDAIAAEQQYVIETMLLARERLLPAPVKLVLENHSDFTPDEYREIVQAVGPDFMGVFLDLINPVAVLADPVATVRALAPYATCGHVKDYRFVSHYVEDGYHRRGFEIQWCYPGEGAADLPTLMGILCEKDATGIYRVAIEGLDNRAGVDDQHRRLDRSLNLLRSLVGEMLAP